MDDLFAAIADHLRRHNRRRPDPIERVWTGTLRAHGGRRVYCRVCGRPITSGEGLFALERLLRDRTCVHCFIPFEVW